MNIAQDAVIVQKTPAGEWDITINWACPTRDLGADIIETSEWEVAGVDEDLDLTDPEIAEDGKSTTIWINGGTLGRFYTVTNTVTTQDERILTGTFLVQIVEYIFLTPVRCI